MERAGSGILARAESVCWGFGLIRHVKRLAGGGVREAAGPAEVCEGGCRVSRVPSVVRRSGAGKVGEEEDSRGFRVGTPQWYGRRIGR